MKSPLLAAMFVLQLATLGLVVGLLLRRNGAAEDPRLRELTAKVEGAVAQERQIVIALDMIRQSLVGSRLAPADPPRGPSDADLGAGAPGAAGTGGPAAPAAAVRPTPFPEAAAALAALKEMWEHRRQERKDNAQNVGPLENELKTRRAALLNQGEGATWVVRRELDLQPFEPERSPGFVEFLLRELVPAISGFAGEDAFNMARSALVRATNEAPVKFAAAQALQQIDSRRWAKEVLDVVSSATGSGDIGIRAQLLGLFAETPRTEAAEVCKRFLEDARFPLELRTKAAMVIARQDSGAVNACLRGVLFEESAPILKNHALDGLWERLTDANEKRKLLDQVVAADPNRMPATVIEKARKMLEQMEPTKPGQD